MDLRSASGKKRVVWITAFAAVFLLAVLAFAGCQGKVGPPGPPGPPGQAATGAAGGITGTLSGKVTGNLSAKPVAGVAITTTPAIQGVTITTGADGTYTATLPVGVYTVSFKKDGYNAATASGISVVAGQKITKDLVLAAAKPVFVNPGKDQTSQPGGSVTLKATAEPLDGSTVSGYKWEQVSGAKATLDGTGDSVKVTLANAGAYKAHLVSELELLDRTVVQGISPHVVVDAEAATFKVTVTTSSGTYTANSKVTVDLPYEVQAGIENVPQGVPVLVSTKKQSSYSWTITGPTGSKAALDSASDRNPVFTPDVVGKYTLKEAGGGSLDVYAGTWAGAISGKDAKGQPLAAGCTVCHNGTIAPDNFKDWKQSGHAAIFTKNIDNPAGHWAINCAQCHSVGYAPKANNGGFDEAVAAEGWKVPPHGDVGTWAGIVSKFPKTAKLANIQCENCHGPNEGSTLHGNKVIDSARVNISSDGCGSCHGEPPRHGRFQQWEESGHGNFELAILDATVENRGATAAHCGRCHSGQGFLKWITQGDLTKQIQGAKGNATVDELKAMGLTKDKIQPQTCVVCHDPHNPGASSGEPNTATVRITGNTSMLPAGFQAKAVGRGAICMTCHNSRNGARNDSIPPPSYSAPHTAAQTDVIMGENAYFVSTGQRSPHASIKDTCATCHMEKSPPPAEFSFQLSGTNHAFKASLKICADCHSNTLDGHAVQVGIEEKVEELAKKMSAYLWGKMGNSVSIVDYTPHDFGGRTYDLKSAAVVIDKANIASVEPTEPHGQIGWLFKFKTPVTFTYTPTGQAPHSVSVTSAEVQMVDVTTDGKTALIALTDPLVRVGWNYFLIHGDGSEGIHNPAFTLEVLEASIKALK